MSRPRIGVLMDVGKPDEHRRVWELNDAYAEAVVRGGGVPVLMPPTRDGEIRKEMLAGVEGVVFPGGPDVDPSLYGQEKIASTKVMDGTRQDYDFAMLALAEARGLPVLGICLGCQEMNVQRRGTLHQSLREAAETLGWEKVEHAFEREKLKGVYSAVQHDVTVRAGSKLRGILGAERVEVNSRHRQGVAKLGHGLVASAYAPDGLVEGFEDPTMAFWVAVQWHPEDMGGTLSDRLFEGLVEAARAYRGGLGKTGAEKGA